MANPNRPLPPLDLLRGFEAAARHLSFTRAAAELFVTQSAVSRQIQALEEFIGAPLFERRHKSLVLTAQGQAYHRAVAAALAQLKEATTRLREAHSGHVLTVTTTVSFASIWLVPRLARFRKEQPGVDVRIKATHEVVDIDREGIDVAIRDMPLDRAPPGAVCLVGERLAAMCSPAYAKDARAQKLPLRSPSDLSRHVLLYLHDPTGRWPWLAWPTWFESRGLDELLPRGALTFDQYDQVLQAAVHGQGVVLGRMTLAEQYIRDKRLIALFGAISAGRGFHAIYAKGAQSRPGVRQFVEWLQREVRREAPEPR
jgi:LysR family glycine cleavage system transcriptional activator